MIELQVFPYDHEFAHNQTKKLEISLKDSKLKSRFNTNWYENNYTGYLGEALFHKWLKTKGIEHEWQNNVFGESDKFDFRIRGKLFDVKTAIRRMPVSQMVPNYKLMLFEPQVGLHADYYIWLLLECRNPQFATKAFLVGFMDKDKVKKYPTVEKIKDLPTKWIPVEDVIPIEELKNVME